MDQLSDCLEKKALEPLREVASNLSTMITELRKQLKRARQQHQKKQHLASALESDQQTGVKKNQSLSDRVAVDEKALTAEQIQQKVAGLETNLVHLTDFHHRVEQCLVVAKAKEPTRISVDLFQSLSAENGILKAENAKHLEAVDALRQENDRLKSALANESIAVSEMAENAAQLRARFIQSEKVVSKLKKDLLPAIIAVGQRQIIEAGEEQAALSSTVLPNKFDARSNIHGVERRLWWEQYDQLDPDIVADIMRQDPVDLCGTPFADALHVGYRELSRMIHFERMMFRWRGHFVLGNIYEHMYTDRQGRLECHGQDIFNAVKKIARALRCSYYLQGDETMFKNV